MAILRQPSAACCPTPKAGLIFRPMNVQELGEAYRNKTDKELLRLALTPEELTPEANVALKSELARRRIDSGAHLDTARQDEKERKAENDRSLGTLGFIPLFGVGRMRFGRGSRVYDPKTGLEQFRTTVFVVLFFFPLIPTGTYLVERKRVLPDKLTVLEKLHLGLGTNPKSMGRGGRRHSIVHLANQARFF